MTANDLPPIPDRILNARFNAAKIEAALIALNKAAKDLSETVANIEATEDEPEFVMGNLKNVVGTIEMAARAARDDGQAWKGYADARARR